MHALIFSNSYSFSPLYIKSSCFTLNVCFSSCHILNLNKPTSLINFFFSLNPCLVCKFINSFERRQELYLSFYFYTQYSTWYHDRFSIPISCEYMEGRPMCAVPWAPMSLYRDKKDRFLYVLSNENSGDDVKTVELGFT
jgi:hypothetical protein